MQQLLADHELLVTVVMVVVVVALAAAVWTIAADRHGAGSYGAAIFTRDPA